MTSAAVDNDVLIKLAAYRLLTDGLALLGGAGRVGVLGAARFVIPSAIARDGRIVDQAGTIAAWQAIRDVVETLEPSGDELEVAALIEERASRSGLPLDSGESQLFAIALSRSIAILATGDKRAIAAAEILRREVKEIAGLDGRVVCLEQLIERLIDELGSESVRMAVCREAMADRAITICMACASAAGDDFSLDGLHSYIADVRRSARSLIGEL